MQPASDSPSVADQAKAWVGLPAPLMRQEIQRRAGLSDQQCASEMSVSRQAWSQWQKGTRKPRPFHLVRYAALLRQLEELTR